MRHGWSALPRRSHHTIFPTEENGRGHPSPIVPATQRTCGPFFVCPRWPVISPLRLICFGSHKLVLYLRAKAIGVLSYGLDVRATIVTYPAA